MLCCTKYKIELLSTFFGVVQPPLWKMDAIHRCLTGDCRYSVIFRWHRSDIPPPSCDTSFSFVCCNLLLFFLSSLSGKAIFPSPFFHSSSNGWQFVTPPCYVFVFLFIYLSYLEKTVVSWEIWFSWNSFSSTSACIVLKVCL